MAGPDRRTRTALRGAPSPAPPSRHPAGARRADAPAYPTARGTATDNHAGSAGPGRRQSAIQRQLAPTWWGSRPAGRSLAAGVFTALAWRGVNSSATADRAARSPPAAAGPGPAGAGHRHRRRPRRRRDRPPRPGAAPRLAATDIETLHVAAVQLTGEGHHRAPGPPAALADPWQSRGQPAGAGLDVPGRRATRRRPARTPRTWAPSPPTPPCVNIGSDTTSSWLLNLEQAGGLMLTGDPAGACNWLG